MKRLTFKKRFEFYKPDEKTTAVCVDGYTQICEVNNADEKHFYLVGKAVDKLAKYEDLEEQCVKDNLFGLHELCEKWKAFFEEIAELLDYHKKQEKGLLLELPMAIGSEVYVITMCKNIEPVLDGTFETATGYYCPFDLKDSCPHDCADCEEVENKLAVFKDTINHIACDKTGVHLFTEDTRKCCIIGEDAFFTKEEAEEALERMQG